MRGFIGKVAVPVALALVAIGYGSAANAQFVTTTAFCDVFKLGINDVGPGPEVFADMALTEVGCEGIPFGGSGVIEIDGNTANLSWTANAASTGVTTEWSCILDLGTLTGTAWIGRGFDDGAGGQTVLSIFGECELRSAPPGISASHLPRASAQ